MKYQDLIYFGYEHEDNSRCWMNSWMKEYLQKERRKDLREEKSGYKSWFM